MGNRKDDSYPDYCLRWPGVGNGRYWKRQLSKARRRYARMLLRGFKPKPAKRVESECNYKTY